MSEDSPPILQMKLVWIPLIQTFRKSERHACIHHCYISPPGKYVLPFLAGALFQLNLFESHPKFYIDPELNFSIGTYREPVKIYQLTQYYIFQMNK